MSDVADWKKHYVHLLAGRDLMEMAETRLAPAVINAETLDAALNAVAETTHQTGNAKMTRRELMGALLQYMQNPKLMREEELRHAEAANLTLAL